MNTNIFEKLEIKSIDFRVGMAGNGKKCPYATLLAYKDARVDMACLDEKFGAMNWQTEYKRDSKGVLQCGIAVWCENKGQWVWKWSNGTESNTEAQKGEYSDAMKRAGFMWGIGRELYDYPFLFTNLEEGEFSIQQNKVKVSNRFRPNDWEWKIENGFIIGIQNSKTRVKAKLNL